MPNMGENKYHDWKRQRQDTERKVKGWVQDELPYNPKPHQYSKEDFYSQVSKANSLTKSEFEELFWKHLVKIGWRIDNEYVVLICNRCDASLFSVKIVTINQTEMTKVSYLKNPTQHTKNHEEWCLTEGENHAV
jgi:hypothetical protein